MLTPSDSVVVANYQGKLSVSFYTSLLVLFLFNTKGVLRMFVMDSKAQLTIDIVAKVIENRMTIANAAISAHY